MKVLELVIISMMLASQSLAATDDAPSAAGLYEGQPRSLSADSVSDRPLRTSEGQERLRDHCGTWAPLVPHEATGHRCFTLNPRTGLTLDHLSDAWALRVGHLRDQIAQNPAGNLGVIVTTWDNGELSLHCLVSSMLFHDVHNIWESGPDNLVVNVTVPGEAGTADVSVPQEYRWRFLLGLIGQSGMSTLIHAMTSSTAVTRIAYFGHVAAWLDGIGKAVPLDSVFCRNRGDHRYISRYDVRTTTWKIRSDVATVSTNPMAARWNQILGYTSAEQPGCSTSSTIPDSWESIFRGLHRAAPSIQWGSESGDVGRPSFWGLFSDYSGGSSDAESEDPYGRKIRVVRSESSWGSMESSPSPR